jgi:hypothetical protein
MQGWSSYFSTVASASAALAGLLFVAVSVNLNRILQFKQLPPRVMEALVTLLTVLLIAILGLVPNQSEHACGIEFASAGLAVWMVQTFLFIRARGNPYENIFFSFILNQLPPLPFIVWGVLLALGHPGGVYWLVPGTIFCFIAGVLNAWVLLIEIQR